MEGRANSSCRAAPRLGRALGEASFGGEPLQPLTVETFNREAFQPRGSWVRGWACERAGHTARRVRASLAKRCALREALGAWPQVVLRMEPAFVVTAIIRSLWRGLAPGEPAIAHRSSPNRAREQLRSCASFGLRARIEIGK